MLIRNLNISTNSQLTVKVDPGWTLVRLERARGLGPEHKCTDHRQIMPYYCHYNKNKNTETGPFCLKKAPCAQRERELGTSVI